MPADYKTTSARLEEIVAGNDWDEMNDLYAFAKFIATRMTYIINAEISDRQMGRKWSARAAFNLFLEWEPTYTTVLNDLGVDLIMDDGSLDLSAVEQLEAIHEGLFPSATEEDKQILAVSMVELVYPYLRNVVSSLTFSAFIPPIVLPVRFPEQLIPGFQSGAAFETPEVLN
jgi:hypothetical protein